MLPFCAAEFGPGTTGVVSHCARAACRLYSLYLNHPERWLVVSFRIETRWIELPDPTIVNERKVPGWSCAKWTFSHLPPLFLPANFSAYLTVANTTGRPQVVQASLWAILV